MAVDKVASYAKATVETLRGAVVVLFSPNAPIPPSKVHQRTPPRPYNLPECIRVLSWRHMWKYTPVIRYYVFSAVIAVGIFKFLIPLKPRHMIMYSQGKQSSHHHEIEHWAGFRQKIEDKEYFKKYNPLRKAGGAEPSGH